MFFLEEKFHSEISLQAPFVQYDGKDGSNLCIKAYAAIYSQVP